MSRTLKYVEFPGNQYYDWKANTSSDTIVSYICSHQSEIIWEYQGTIQSSPSFTFFANRSSSGTSDTCFVIAKANSHYSISAYSVSEGNATIGFTFRWQNDSWVAPNLRGFRGCVCTGVSVINGVSYNKWVDISKSPAAIRPSVTGYVLYTPVSWGLLTQNYKTQVESTICDGDGLSIVDTYYKNSTATTSGGTKVSRAAETGNWSDLVSKPVNYKHRIRLATSDNVSIFCFNLMCKKDTAFSSLGNLYTYFGGIAPTRTTPMRVLSLPIRFTGMYIADDTVTSGDYWGDLLFSVVITATYLIRVGVSYKVQINTLRCANGAEVIGDRDYTTLTDLSVRVI